MLMLSWPSLETYLRSADIRPIDFRLAQRTTSHQAPAWSLRMSDSVGVPPIGRVNIRPGVSVLSILRHLNYKPWFALAEFVDNSLQSSFDSKEDLSKIVGNDFKAHIN